jgi:hypothetical protein
LVTGGVRRAAAWSCDLRTSITSANLSHRGETPLPTHGAMTHGANALSMTLVVRRCFQRSAGKS